MSRLDQSLMMPIWAIPDNLAAQVTAARGRINGVGANADTATAEDRALAARFQFLNADEKRAAEAAHAANRPLPAAVQARINGTARPSAAPAATDAPAAAAPQPVIPAIASPITVNNNDLKTDYTALRARIDLAMRNLRAQEQADKDKGAQAIRKPEEYAVIYTLMARISENANEVYGKLDTEVSKTGVTPQQLRVANQFSDAYLARLTTQIGEVESRSRSNPGDPFDATKFFDDNIKPTLLLASTTMGEMTRKGWDALTTGLGVMGRAVAGAVRDPAGTANDIAAGATAAGNRFMSNLNGGSITGGLLGGLGAFLISNMFGSGPIKWLLMLLLVPVGVMLGGSKLGGPINNFFSGIFGGRNRNGGEAAAPSPETQVDAPTRGQGRDDRSNNDRDSENGEFRPMTREELRGVVPSSVARSTRYDPEFAEKVFSSAYNEGYLDARRGGIARYDGYVPAPRGSRDDSRDRGYNDDRRDTRDSRRESRRDDRRDDRSDVELEVRGNSYGIRTEYGSVRQYDGLRNPGWSMRPR